MTTIKEHLYGKDVGKTKGPFEDGWNPFEEEKVFLDGHFFYSFSNEHGEEWAAYIELETNDVVVSGVDVGWKWKIFNPGSVPYPVPWNLNSDEQDWLSVVFRMARKFKKRKSS